jgi:hypothetical protein
VYKFGRQVPKGLRLMGYTPSVDASQLLRLRGYTLSGDALHLLRLILDAPAHQGDELGPDQARDPLTPVSKVDRIALRKNGCKDGCLDIYYPRGEGLATSPCHRARLPFHGPNFRV